MKQTLVLKFHGPMQAWGANSRFQHRQTHNVPTKSGVIGLLSAAQGRRRSDTIEDLVQLEFGVRVDQSGSLMRDFQTAVDWRKGPPGKLSERYYLADALFLVAISGDTQLLAVLEKSLKHPAFPLYLGRRSCPAGPDLVLGLHEGDVEQSLRAQPWFARAWHRRMRPKQVSLPIYRDAQEGEISEDRLRDIPISFDPEHRQYGWRFVHAPEPVLIDNPDGTQQHDPFWEAVIGS